jgi:hypothetical protein
MKITEQIDRERYATAWKKGMKNEGSWLSDAEVSLSPAAQAQVLPKGANSTGPMPHLSPMHGMYNAWEFGGWKEEAMQGSSERIGCTGMSAALYDYEIWEIPDWKGKTYYYRQRRRKTDR